MLVCWRKDSTVDRLYKSTDSHRFPRDSTDLTILTCLQPFVLAVTLAHDPIHGRFSLVVVGPLWSHRYFQQFQLPLGSDGIRGGM